MSEKIFMKGCEAVAETAVRAGCRFFAGYPITPQNLSLIHISYSDVEEHTRIFIWVSLGPETTPTPEPTPSPTPPQESGDPGYVFMN